MRHLLLICAFAALLPGRVVAQEVSLAGFVAKYLCQCLQSDQPAQSRQALQCLRGAGRTYETALAQRYGIDVKTQRGRAALIDSIAPQLLRECGGLLDSLTSIEWEWRWSDAESQARNYAYRTDKLGAAAGAGEVRTGARELPAQRIISGVFVKELANGELVFARDGVAFTLFPGTRGRAKARWRPGEAYRLSCRRERREDALAWVIYDRSKPTE